MTLRRAQSISTASARQAPRGARAAASPTCEQDYPLSPALHFLQRVWQLNHALERLSSRMERSLGVTAQQRLAIRFIGKYPGVGASVLAAILRVDPGTVSVALRRLEQKGLLARRKDPRDQRRAALGLTAQGRALDRPTRGTAEAAVERLLAELPAHDAAVTLRVLERFSELLELEH